MDEDPLELLRRNFQEGNQMVEKTRGVIEAAGGIVWRRSPRGTELTLIFDPIHMGWTLPAGDLNLEESWQDAACRTVYELTGCKVRSGVFAGAISYEISGIPKVVLFWNMGLENPMTEIIPQGTHEISWMTVAEASDNLMRSVERRLVNEVAEVRWPDEIVTDR